DAGGKALALAEEHQVLEYDIAGGARRERAAAKATERAVEDARAFVERRGSVRNSHAAGVVQMDADRRLAGNLHRRFGQIANRLRPGIAHGIGDADRIDASLEAFFNEPDHLLRVDGTGDGATQRHRDRGMNDRFVRAGITQLTHTLDVGDRGFARAMGIGLAMLLRRRHHGGDFGDAGCERLVDATLVQRQCNAMRAGQRRDGRNDVADIDELRKGLGRQEGADLEAAHAGGVFVANPALLGPCGRVGFDELKAVAQADLAQGDAAIRIDFLNVGHARFLMSFSVSSLASSARMAAVSAPRGATFSPSPILAPFHSIGNAGTRNGAPSTLKFLTRPPGRSTCASVKRSSGRLIGEKQILSESSFSESAATSQPLMISATRGMIRERARMRSVVVRRFGSSRNSCIPNSRQKLCQCPSVTTPMKIRWPSPISKMS